MRTTMTYIKEGWGILAKLRSAGAIFILGLVMAVTGLQAEASGPFPFSLGTVSGFTDFHGHQMGQLGMGGRQYYGSHQGPEHQALGGCNGFNHAISWLPGAVTALVGQPDLGIHNFRTHGHHSNPDKNYKDWPVWLTTTHQGYWEGWLKKAHQDGLRLFVMSAVNFDMFCSILPATNTNSEVLADLIANPQNVLKQCDDMVNVERQLKAAHAFAAANSSWYQIAKTPTEARSIINQGKLAVILSVEASKIWGNIDDTDWDAVKARLDKLEALGVRSFQMVHEIDNNVGGVAFFHIMFDIFTAINNAITFVPSALAGNFSDFKNVTFIVKDANNHNVKGLTTLGEKLARELIARKHIVDLTHLSERSVNDFYAIAKENKYYPMFFSHAHFRDLFREDKRDEKKLSLDMVKKIKETGGVIGLRPAPERVKTYNYSGVTNNCHGSSRSVAQSYMLGRLSYGLSIGFGLDMTGMIAQARPRFFGPNSKWNGTIGDNAPHKWACGANSTNDDRLAGRAQQGSRSANGTGTDYDYIGLAHVGHVRNMLQDLNNLGVDTNHLEDSTEHFVVMWERINNSNRLKKSNYASNVGIDHTTYTKDCPLIFPSPTDRREKLGTKYKDTTGGVPNYVNICKAWPHSNIQNRNCSSYGIKNGAYCIKSRDGGKWWSARLLEEDKCPVPHTKISGLYRNGKIACQDTLDRNIQERNCSGSGKYKWGSRCVVSESSYHVRVRTIIEDKCPVPHVKLNGISRNGRIICRDGYDANIQRHSCSGGGKYVWSSGRDYCIMTTSSYYYRVKYVINDNCPTGYWLQRRHASNQKPLCKPTVTSKITSSKCTRDGGSRYSGYCIWNKGYWYKARVLK